VTQAARDAIVRTTLHMFVQYAEGRTRAAVTTSSRLTFLQRKVISNVLRSWWSSLSAWHSGHCC
jgi:hypothetical protein